MIHKPACLRYSQVWLIHRIDPMPSSILSSYGYAVDNPVMFEDPSGAEESLGQFLANTLYNSKSDGGTWTNDGTNDNNGDPMGGEDDFNSNGEAFEAGAFYNMTNGYGDWETNPAGAYAGAFYNYVTSTGNVDIPNYAEFRSESFQTLPGVTINVNDPASWVAAQNTILNELEQSLDKLTPAGEALFGAASLSFDATRHGLMGAQMLGNSFGGTSYAIQDIGKLRLARLGNFGELTVEEAGHGLVYAGALLTVGDMIENGVTWSNGTDLFFDGVAFVPVVGWAISGAYFLGNFIVEDYTGQSIGDHIGEGLQDSQVQNAFEQWANSPWQ